MSLQNTVYQTHSFNVGRDLVCIDGDEIFYRVQKDCVVINSRLIPFSMYGENIINYFFDKFQYVSCLKFENAVGKEDEVLTSNTLREKALDSNFLLILPDDLKTYTQSLGTKTRQHLNQYLRNIEKELKISGDMCQSLNLNESSRHIFDEICNLNHERFAAKGVKSGLNKDSLFNSIKQYGVLNYLMIGDKVVAGTIGSVYNSQFCLHVIAHDNNYSKFNLGNIILLKTIEYVINLGIHNFNFLWGHCEYKTRFGAKESLFYNYYVYRKKHFEYYFHKIDMYKRLKKMIKIILRPPYRALQWMYHQIVRRKGC